MYPEWTTAELAERLNRGEKLNLVDVRELDEWQSGHIAKARHVPMSELAGRVSELFEDQDEVVLICRSGGRSTRVCDYLSQQGYSVINVAGGMLSWDGEVVTGD